jgi:hypothetical protein
MTLTLTEDQALYICTLITMDAKKALDCGSPGYAEMAQDLVRLISAAHEAAISPDGRVVCRNSYP